MQLVIRASAIEKSALLAFGLAAAALFVFVELAGEIAEGNTHAFDETILLALRSRSDTSDPLGPAWFEEMMRDFTALGSLGVLGAISFSVVGFLVLARKRHAALMVAGSVVGGILLSSLLKWTFDRPRPDLVPHGSIVYTQSFPSSHAMLSAVVYLTLGVLLARTRAEPRVKLYFLSVAAIATIMVGISRIYLGVHWPTDVLAGWVIGTAWALLCWLIMLWLQGHGQLEPETAANGDPPE